MATTTACAVQTGCKLEAPPVADDNIFFTYPELSMVRRSTGVQ